MVRLVAAGTTALTARNAIDFAERQGILQRELREQPGESNAMNATYAKRSPWKISAAGDHKDFLGNPPDHGPAGSKPPLPAATANDSRDKWLYRRCCRNWTPIEALSAHSKRKPGGSRLRRFRG